MTTSSRIVANHLPTYSVALADRLLAVADRECVGHEHEEACGYRDGADQGARNRAVRILGFLADRRSGLEPDKEQDAE